MNLKYHNYYYKDYYKDKYYLPEHLTQTINQILQEHKLRSVLEVGCGPGCLLHFLRSKGYDACGCDISFYAAKESNQVNADAIHLPFKDEGVDSLIAISLIEHLSFADGQSFLQEAKRVIKKNGIIFLVTPNKWSLKSIVFGEKRVHMADPSHIYIYSPYSLSSELKKVEFNNINWTFPFPRDCSLKGWSMPGIIQKNNAPFIRNFINWILISSPAALIRDTFWIFGQK